jgi:hypothetical protein
VRWLVVAVVLAGCRLGFEDVTGMAGTGDSGGGSASGDAGVIPDAGQVTTMPIDAAPGTLLPVLVADSYIQGTDVSPNGGEIDVSVGRYTGSGANMWGLWQFDLTGIPQQAVSKATLRLYQYSAVGAMTLGYEIHSITAAWDEASVDWTHPNTSSSWSPGGPISTNVYATSNVALGTYGYYDWDITTLVNEWLTGVQPNYGLEMKYVSQPPPGTYAMFASKEHTTTAWHAQLLIAP